MESNSRVLLIGSGGMACEYLKVLKSLNKSVVVVGRGEQNIENLKKQYPEYDYHTGGLQDYLDSNPAIPEFAINTVNIEYLGDTSCQLLEKGVKYLLIEKPGDLTEAGLGKIKNIAHAKGSKVLVAYNRRFFSSVLKVLSESEKDGGITSVHFEFTEWAHTFGPDTHSLQALNKWVLSNSSHVIDTVFFLIGKPKEISTKVLGVGRIDWHPTGSIFIGAGVSNRDIPFGYHSNWNGPGRWAIEVITNKRRFYLKPMEKLFEQALGSVSLNEVVIDDKLDAEFKPGLFLQTQAFLDLELENLQTIEDQYDSMEYYRDMAGY